MELLYVETAAISVFIIGALLIEWGIYWRQDQAAMDLAHELLVNPQRTFGLSQSQRRKMRYYQSCEQLANFAIVFLIWLVVMQLVTNSMSTWFDYLYLYIYILQGCLVLRWHFSHQLHWLLVDTYGLYSRAAKIFEIQQRK